MSRNQFLAVGCLCLMSSMLYAELRVQQYISEIFELLLTKYICTWKIPLYCIILVYDNIILNYYSKISQHYLIELRLLRKRRISCRLCSIYYIFQFRINLSFKRFCTFLTKLIKKYQSIPTGINCNNTNILQRLMGVCYSI